MGQLKYRTLNQHKVLFGLLNKLKWIKHRKDLAAQFSSDRTESTKKLYENECDLLIEYLKTEISKGKEEAELTKKELLQRKFFFYCHELGWKRNGKLDYVRINNWLLKYGYLKKPLKQYEEQEMSKLLQQVEKVLERKKKPKE